MISAVIPVGVAIDFSLGRQKMVPPEFLSTSNSAGEFSTAAAISPTKYPLPSLKALLPFKSEAVSGRSREVTSQDVHGACREQRRFPFAS